MKLKTTKNKTKQTAGQQKHWKITVIKTFVCIIGTNYVILSGKKRS